MVAGGPDPRIGELRVMGLSAEHIGMAEALGFDAFIAWWRYVSERPAFQGEDGIVALTIRSFRSYLRFQRNRYIESLHQEGKSAAEIKERVLSELREEITERHIYRLVAGL